MDPLPSQQVPMYEGTMSWGAEVVQPSLQTIIIAAKTENRVLRSSALIPLYAAAISTVLLILHLITRIPPIKRFIRRLQGRPIDSSGSRTREGGLFAPSTTFQEELKEHVAAHGGLTIFLCNTLRLALCLTLLGLSIHAAIVAPGPGERASSLGGDFDAEAHKKWGKHGKGKKHRHRKGDEWFSELEWIEIAQSAFYTYVSFLALFTLVARRTATRVVSRHLTTLLLIAFGVFAYRDLYPLATLHKHPLDAAEGWLTWSRVGLLTAVGFILPLSVPTQYLPVDPSNPSTPHPEQTASLFSFIFFFFLDPLIKKASKVDHLPYEELPVLADYDVMDHLTKEAWPVLDPTLKPVKGRHIFFGLMWFYRWEYFLLAIVCVLKAICDIASPITLSRLLLYLETGGVGMYLQPWVWIAFLFIAPVAASVCMQAYIWRTTRLLVRTEGIITQLVFEHALRIRMKDDTRTPGASSAVTTAVHTPSASAVELVPEEAERQSSETSETTARGSESQSPVDTTKKDKGKASPPPPSPPPPPPPPAEEQHGSNLVGKITNLISTDLGNIIEGRDILLGFFLTPLQIVISIIFLYQLLGWSALVGLSVMLLTLPIPSYVAQLVNRVQVEQMKKTDARVQAVTESMNVIRMVKLFGWEKKVETQVDEKREIELQYVWKKTIYNLVNNNINHFLPLLTMIATFSTYTLIMKQELTASRIFSSIAVFDVIRDYMHMSFWQIAQIIQAKVSLDRVNAFLNETELLDRYTKPSDDSDITVLPPTADADTIGFRNATFTWRTDLPATPSGILTPSRRNFRLRIEGDLFFRPGKLNLVIGPTGCGKTSLLMALLGEMHFSPESIDAYFNLPRHGGIAYAAQEAWIQNATVKNNILFGAPYDEQRYKKVIRQCALERDLTLFEAGDETEIGEKGVTLSGGQKARVSLARAVYSSAQVILLDDVLSALDVHTSRAIVDECFTGDLIQGRTVILVTHNVAMTSPIADFVVSLGLDGRVRSQGNASDALSKDPTLLKEFKESKEVLQKDEEVIDPADEAKPKEGKPSGQLVMKEEIAVGRVGWPAFKFFFRTFGGFAFWAAFLLALMLAEVFTIMQSWFLGYWAKQYNETNDPSSIYVPWYLGVYALIILGTLLFYNPGVVLYNYGVIRGARKIHKLLLQSILGTSLRWLDSTPTGRIVARFTQDMRAIDNSLGSMFSGMVDMTIGLIFKFGAVLVYSPVFLVPGLSVAGFGAWLGQLYIRAQLAVKREMSNAKSPVLSHFGASIAGLTSIRAYGVEETFKAESKSRINHYTRCGRTFYNLNRWISIRIDALGGLFASSLAAYLVYGRKFDPSTTGFSLTMALGFTGLLLWWVRFLNEFEVQGNSIERIKAYVEIEQEPKSTDAGTPPAYWPASGSLSVEKLCARYSPDGPEVLHDISFEIKSGEHVGVVGRTGAGKSSLSLALLRMIPTSGTVTFDGIDTSKVNLDALRNNITIIPQQPELMSGSLRQNLDPFGEHDDATLNSCLRSAGLFNLQTEDDENKIGLDTAVSSGGSNFSLGQRQIIALARAMVRRSKVYLFDEATASVDNETDTAIQEVIKTEFTDMTLIIVAHRLQTIMTADKVLVLDAGRVIEFDSPENLLKKDGSFKALVDGSGDKDALYEMARKSGEGSSSQEA